MSTLPLATWSLLSTRCTINLAVSSYPFIKALAGCFALLCLDTWNEMTMLNRLRGHRSYLDLFEVNRAAGILATT